MAKIFTVKTNIPLDGFDHKSLKDKLLHGEDLVVCMDVNDTFEVNCFNTDDNSEDIVNIISTPLPNKSVFIQLWEWIIGVE